MSNGAKPLIVSPPVRHELERRVRDPNMPRKLVLRARIVLGAADGLSNSELASQLGTSRPTVIHWRRRFAEGHGVVALLPLHPGRKKTLTAEKIATIESVTLQSTPPNGIRWSTRALARAQGVSHSSIFRIWKDRDLQIHLLETFGVRDIAALYLNSVDAVAVFIGDNNCQIQARDDTRSVLRVGPRVFVRRSHETGTQSQLREPSQKLKFSGRESWAADARSRLRTPARAPAAHRRAGETRGRAAARSKSSVPAPLRTCAGVWRARRDRPAARAWLIFPRRARSRFMR